MAKRRADDRWTLLRQSLQSMTAHWRRDLERVTTTEGLHKLSTYNWVLSEMDRLKRREQRRRKKAMR